MSGGRKDPEFESIGDAFKAMGVSARESSDAFAKMAESLNEQDDYKGSSGWVVVAVGHGGQACVLDVDPGFGSLRWVLNEIGVGSVEDLGLVVPEDIGIYKTNAKAMVISYRHFEGGDMTFDVEEPGWQDLFPDGIPNTTEPAIISAQRDSFKAEAERLRSDGALQEIRALSEEDLERIRDSITAELEARKETWNES